jgi:arylsulfatase A-like enzyme
MTVFLFPHCSDDVVEPCGSIQTAKPNVIIIMVDDLGQEVLQSYGGQSYSTPNINRLAGEGLQFDNAYATYNCHTTRAEILTGQYPFKSGWDHFFNDGKCFDSSKFNLGRMFKDAGYNTGIVGKWHLCLPEDDPSNVLDCGFDETLVWTWKVNGLATSRFWQPVLWNGTEIEASSDPDDYGPDMFLERAKEFISSSGTEPFFLYYPMVLVHSPFTPTPDQGRPDQAIDDPIVFGFMAEYMDKIVGDLMCHLDQLGLRENTVVIFTGDNGTDELVYSYQNGKLIQGGKNTMFETGINMPFIVRWPGHIAPSTVTDELIDFTDVIPTCADIVGGSIPQAAELQGVSFLNVLCGGESNRSWIYSQFSNKWALRDKRWKLNQNNSLFDLTIDPEEKNPIKPLDDNIETAARRAILQGYYDDLVN